MLRPASSSAELATRIRRVSLGCAGAGLVLGALVLFGWSAGIEPLKRVAPGLVAMNPLTAVCFILSALSLGSVWRREAPAHRPFALAAGVTLALIGAVRIAAYLGGGDWAPDHLLFPHAVEVGPERNRMALLTAVNFVLIGVALAAMARGGARPLFGAHLLALAAFCVSLLALTGYVYHTAVPYTVSDTIPMALHTSVGFILIAAGLFLHRVGEGPLWVIEDMGAGGILARRILPLALLAPLVLGWLSLRGQYAGLYGVDFGAALFSITCVVLFVALVWVTATRAARVEHERRAAEEALRRAQIQLSVEEARRESEERFQLAAEGLTDHIFVIDIGSGRVEWFGGRPRSGAQAPVLPRTWEEWIEMVHPDDRERVLAHWEQSLETGAMLSEEYRHLQPESQPIMWQVRASIVKRDGEATRWIGTCTDVTEQRRSEEQLRQVQKMETVGQLAGGIAHDFNNLLQVILGHCQFAIGELSRTHPAHEDLLQILAAADQAAALTKHLLTFSRRQPAERETIALGDLVGNLLRLLSRLLGSHIEVTIRPAAGLPPVLGDPHQIEQVLMNLCLNARDAMPGGGKLLVEITATSLDEEFCRSHPWAVEGRYVLLSVSDTGDGIPQEIQSRIFEPFFTTKGPGKGTGMGLATVYGIVQSHGGLLHVYSDPGAGTTFKVYLPVAEAAEAAGDRGAADAIVGGTEAILVAEDEASIRRIATQILRNAGYRVLEAENGTAALEVLEASADSIDLAVLDVVMPGLTGPRLAEIIRERWPNIGLLLTSGHGIEPHGSDGVPGRTLPQLAKPYAPSALLRQVRQVLDRPSTV